MVNHLFTRRGFPFSLKINLVLFLWLVCTAVSAQKISGVVEGNDGQPLSQANIVGLNGGKQMLCYAITDEKGHFTLSVNDSVITIKISCLGYRSKEIPLTKMKSGMTIPLEKDKYMLKEVTVRAQRIRSSGDTLTYSVAGFRQRQDRSIGDVIAKMPGIEVTSNGTVKYQGKTINKFYIEGMDLMGGLYGIANKNIPADKIQSVQVLKNHQPVKSLHGIQFSDQAALNLVLNDNAKGVWSGTADLGLGYGKNTLYDNRVMGLNFNRQFQTLMMYKNNDTGKDISTEVRDLITPSNSLSEDENGLLSLISISAPNLKPERYTFNHSHLVAGNWLWKTGRNSTLRFQGNAFLDKSDLSLEESTTYLTVDGMPVIMEDEGVKNTQSEWKGEVNYEYNGNQTYVNNNLRGYIDFDKSIGNISLDGTDHPSMVKPRKRYLSDDFQLSHTTSRKQVYKWNANIDYYDLPGQLLTAENETENLTLHYLKARTTLDYAIPIGKHQIGNTFGAEYNDQDIKVTTALSPEGVCPYHQETLFWTPSLNLLFGSQTVALKAKTLLVHQSYRQSRSHHLWIEPGITYHWDMSGMSAVSATLSQTHTPLTAEDIFDTPIFTDYRTREVNRGETAAKKSTVLTGSYQYDNPLTGLFFYIQPSWSRSTGNILYKTQLDKSIYTIMATDSSCASSTMELTTRVSKSFSWAKAYIAVGMTSQRTDYRMLVSNDLDKARIYYHTFYLDYSLRPWQFMSMEGKSSLLWTQQKNLTDRQLSAGSTLNWKHELGIYFFFTPKIMMSWNNELLHTNKKALGTNYFCDMSLDYKGEHSEFSIAVNNIIGKSKSERISLTDTMRTYSVTRLRPREFIVKWSFDIN